MSSVLLALDLGTTGVRALAIDREGSVLSRAYQTLGTRFPGPGRVEHDLEEMWTSSLSVLREALQASGRAARDVAGIGVATQRATALAWDAQSGLPLAPAIGWQDQRESNRLHAIRERGLPITSLPAANKFAWWIENDDAIRDAHRAGHLMLGTPDAWLTAKLCGGGVHCTDPGEASCTGLYHLGEGGWSEVMGDLFEVPLECLPRVVATSEVVGETPTDLFGHAIPVAARAGDQQAATFAHGVHEAGGAKLTLGTSAMLDLHAGETPPADVPGCFPMALWRLADTDTFLLEGSVLTAGAVLDWLVEIGVLDRPGSADDLARGVPDSAGVCFVPSLQGLGTPYMEAAARGFVGGLTRGAGRAHLARAALEGIAHRCVDAVHGLPETPDLLHVDGGLARSDFLLETLANLWGGRVARPAEIETTALGVAQLAGLVTGVYREPAECRPSGPEPRVFEPNMSQTDRQTTRDRWRQMVDTRVLGTS